MALLPSQFWVLPKHLLFRGSICREDISVCTLDIFQKWNDCLLKWNPSDYNNTDFIIVPISEIWQPDLYLFDRYTKSLNSFFTIYDAMNFYNRFLKLKVHLLFRFWFWFFLLLISRKTRRRLAYVEILISFVSRVPLG